MKKLTLAILAVIASAMVSAQAEPLVGLTSDNRLIFFDSATPATITKTLNVTGLATGETLLGIDFRPRNGVLYGLGSSSRGYLIDVSTGEAFAGATGAFTLNGTRFGFDFNPVVDRVRITSDADQNLRINPDDGTLTATDGTLNYAAGDRNAGANPNVVGSAYTNNFSGATATVLYDIDSALDTLVIQNPPNSGTLNTVGSLGVVTSDNVGFDISGVTGTPYASLTVSGVTSLFTINLASGAATLVGPIASSSTLGGATVVDISAVPVTPTRIRQLSTRARVGTGQDVMIAGFITRGGQPTTMVGRAIGPSLAAKGVASPLQDPVLEVYDGNGALIAVNDDYGTSAQLAQIQASGLAPTDARESAVYGTIAPGDYTVLVRGKGTDTGIALVEVYDVTGL